jgi:hypothetical protein
LHSRCEFANSDPLIIQEARGATTVHPDLTGDGKALACGPRAVNLMKAEHYNRSTSMSAAQAYAAIAATFHEAG